MHKTKKIAEGLNSNSDVKRNSVLLARQFLHMLNVAWTEKKNYPCRNQLFSFPGSNMSSFDFIIGSQGRISSCFSKIIQILLSVKPPYSCIQLRWSVQGNRSFAENRSQIKWYLASTERSGRPYWKVYQNSSIAIKKIAWDSLDLVSSNKTLTSLQPRVKKEPLCCRQWETFKKTWKQLYKE